MIRRPPRSTRRSRRRTLFAPWLRLDLPRPRRGAIPRRRRRSAAAGAEMTGTASPRVDPPFRGEIRREIRDRGAKGGRRSRTIESRGGARDSVAECRRERRARESCSEISAGAVKDGAWRRDPGGTGERRPIAGKSPRFQRDLRASGKAWVLRRRSRRFREGRSAFQKMSSLLRSRRHFREDAAPSRKISILPGKRRVFHRLGLARWRLGSAAGGSGGPRFDDR